MSILASLVRACRRLPDAPPFGFSSEKIGFCIVLNPDGSVASVEDLRSDDKKPVPRMLLVPQPWKKASGIKPNFLWEKSSYLLGVTAGDGRRTAAEHAAFVARHNEWLRDTDDQGLVAFLRFLANWKPQAFAPPLWPDDMRDQNIVFGLAGQYLETYLHDRPAAKKIWRAIKFGESRPNSRCLVTGEIEPIARLHPSIKGVWGAQSSGASLVSFNDDAYESYDHEQGDNAPVSEAAAFAYTTALNRFLERDSGHRIQIGDASTVFWADCSDMKIAEEAESIFSAFLDTTPAQDDRTQTNVVASHLERIRSGQNLAEIEPKLVDGVRFHVLGLAPNAARLSVRFYWEGDFGQLTDNYQRYLADTELKPSPDEGWPPLWRYLVELAVMGKRENVPPLVAGEWTRAILTGTPYPMTLLSTTLMRIRADHEVNFYRAALLKSVLIRNFDKEAPVALDPEFKDKGYVLGRLFAVYEEVQRAALGNNVNATIKDKFYGSASATPQKVFHLIDAGAQNHFAKLKKQSPGRAVNLEKLLTSITDLMEPGADPIPDWLSAAEQALFGIGYYHQRSDFFRKREDKETAA